MLITFANSLDPDQDSKHAVLIWIQSVWHSDSVYERIFWKSKFWKKSDSADDNKEKIRVKLTITSTHMSTRLEQHRGFLIRADDTFFNLKLQLNSHNSIFVIPTFCKCSMVKSVLTLIPPLFFFYLENVVWFLYICYPNFLEVFHGQVCINPYPATIFFLSWKCCLIFIYMLSQLFGSVPWSSLY